MLIRTSSLLLLLTCILALSPSCKKDSETPANPLATLNGTWKNTTWGGVAGNNMIINISQSSATAVVQSIGTQTFNYAVGETILSNITPATGSSVFNGTGIFKYGTGNQTVASTTAVITLQNNNQEISVSYAPVNGIQPPTYVYSRQ